MRSVSSASSGVNLPVFLESFRDDLMGTGGCFGLGVPTYVRALRTGCHGPVKPFGAGLNANCQHDSGRVVGDSEAMLKVLINAVVSMGRRNTKHRPTLH
jgi:hypothetical protein